IICMESALLIYQYTDRVPNSWRIAVNRDTGKTKFQIAYPKVTPIYVSKSYLYIGIDEKEINGVKVKIYDRERTICDCLRYMNKMDAEIFRKAIKAYLKDKEQNIGKPVQYGKIFKITKKIDTYVGVWL
ncbi:MAG TPA: hypothetical protein DEG71_01300, partial [Clostridiales bacterium]|nr:hypothetical protein [Clostridiales bacterium]